MSVTNPLSSQREKSRDINMKDLRLITITLAMMTFCCMWTDSENTAE